MGKPVRQQDELVRQSEELWAMQRYLGCKMPTRLIDSIASISARLKCDKPYLCGEFSGNLWLRLKLFNDINGRTYHLRSNLGPPDKSAKAAFMRFLNALLVLKPFLGFDPTRGAYTDVNVGELRRAGLYGFAVDRFHRGHLYLWRNVLNGANYDALVNEMESAASEILRLRRRRGHLARVAHRLFGGRTIH